MEISETLYVVNRDEWRLWLAHNHATAKEIWLIYYNQASGKPRIPYVHAVEEALCFGWIDGIQKRHDAESTVQRFTPRRPKSNWSELNKGRARRMIARGAMTEAGRRLLPDLTLEPLQIAPDILHALQADPQAWENFQRFDAEYQRLRISYIEDGRRQAGQFEKRLANFLNKTRANKLFGSLE